VKYAILLPQEHNFVF